MKRLSFWCGSVVAAVSFAAILSAQAPLIDVKMGLWEMTSTSQMTGDMPSMVDTSKLPPEQKARVEQSMKAAMAPHTTTDKSCLTKEKFEKPMFMMNDQRGMNCKQNITTNTRTTLEATVTCTGQAAMTGTMRFDAQSPTSVKGTVVSDATTPQGKMKVNITMTGKWLGADCGDTK